MGALAWGSLALSIPRPPSQTPAMLHMAGKSLVRTKWLWTEGPVHEGSEAGSVGDKVPRWPCSVLILSILWIHNRSFV